METRAILDFFEENNCEISMYLIGCYLNFDIYSKVSETWILSDANDFMLKEFYLECITPKN
jgi:hypothetical protein